MVRTVLLPLFCYCFSFAFCILILLSIYPHSVEMALNCSHMLSSIFVVRSIAISSGPVTGPVQCRKDFPSTGFMWQIWNVKGRPLNVCYVCAPWRILTQNLLSSRKFILPILTAHLWSYQHLTTFLSPVPGRLFCSAHLLRVADLCWVFWPLDLPCSCTLLSAIAAVIPTQTWLLPSLIVIHFLTGVSPSCFLISLYLLDWASYMFTVTFSGLSEPTQSGIQCLSQNELMKR